VNDVTIFAGSESSDTRYYMDRKNAGLIIRTSIVQFVLEGLTATAPVGMTPRFSR